jgi:hypothetical protein
MELESLPRQRLAIGAPLGPVLVVAGLEQPAEVEGDQYGVGLADEAQLPNHAFGGERRVVPSPSFSVGNSTGASPSLGA